MVTQALDVTHSLTYVTLPYARITEYVEQLLIERYTALAKTASQGFIVKLKSTTVNQCLVLMEPHAKVSTTALYAILA